MKSSFSQNSLLSMVDTYSLAIDKYQTQLQTALNHLNYSFKKINQLPTHPDQLDEEGLQTWEGYCSRFARVVDLFLTKYMRAKVLQDDPGFTGTLRDFVNQGEKLGLVDSADQWMILRGLRNIESHTYEDDLDRFLIRLREQGPVVLLVEAKL